LSEKFQIHTRWSHTQQEIFFKRFPAFLCPFLMVKKKYWLRFSEKVAVGSEWQSGSFLEQDSTAVIAILVEQASISANQSRRGKR